MTEIPTLARLKIFVRRHQAVHILCRHLCRLFSEKWPNTCQATKERCRYDLILLYGRDGGLCAVGSCGIGQPIESYALTVHLAVTSFRNVD